ncbi:MAG: glycosyltransferase family 2 protein [Candidatus Palauibacterales bacterium]|jgi:glycosyltransferase involved in cell wall biosynthesis|nr:glycosyltransferase family 2 protein [Candidatus Palauibacterales bacterium]MDP2483210.1 glycosyltransferase family 2 protein [Candidatus Palauibacterales bacterium]
MTGSGPSPGDSPPPASRFFSVLIPAFNEVENMPDLFRELAGTFQRSGLDGEIILVDDGSTDGTLEAAREAAQAAGIADRTVLLHHRINKGKTAAMMTAARVSRAPILVLFDADLQHSTDQIPRFVDALDHGYDVVAGRKIGDYSKHRVSRIYNGLSRAIFQVPVRDLNSMKAFRREVLDEIHLREDWHRYLIVLAHDRGFRVGEIDIELLPRRHGVSKYSGQGRVVVGLLDLVSVWFQLVFSRKPMLFFGITGLGLAGLGVIVGLVALFLRYALGAGFRPLLTLVVFLVLLGGLLFTAGLLAELIAGLRAEVEDLRRELRR